MVINYSCKDYLDVVPDNVPTIDNSFTDKVGAEKFLSTCYSYLPNFGSANSDPAMLGSDEYWLDENESFYTQYYSLNGIYLKKDLQNTDNPIFNFWVGQNGANKLYSGIRDCNTFLEKIVEVGADLSEEDRIRWIAEVKFLKAYYHYYLLRLFGPIPLVKQNLPISASIDEVQVYRDPFDDCVNYITELIDEAVPDLPMIVSNRTTELGHITRPIALSIKAKILVTAASPLFNGNSDYDNLKDNTGRNLFNPVYDKQKWEKAMVACKNAIDTCLSANIYFYKFDYPMYSLSDSTLLLMSLRHVVADKWNSELIWANSRNVLDQLTRMSLPFFDSSQLSTGLVTSNLAPTLNMAELFYTNHGVPIDEDKSFDYTDRYNLTTTPDNQKYYVLPGFRAPILHLNREPRFYANLGFDGGIWFGNGRYNDVGVGTSNTQSWVLHMKKGEASGNTSNLKYSITGYYPKKLSHFESVHPSTQGSGLVLVRTTFPIMRLSDLYLLYAEALNEYNDQPTPEVYKYIDIIRAKAGLEGVKESWTEYSKNTTKPDTKEGMRSIIQQERLIELAFEGKRFWDLRRWKLAYFYYNQPVKAWNTNGKTDDFYIPKILYNYTFGTKNYLWPIKESTLRSDINLVQNPYW